MKNQVKNKNFEIAWFIKNDTVKKRGKNVNEKLKVTLKNSIKKSGKYCNK